ncbi:hypothetical protein BROSI_A3273 [Candidatus Brocadia sinica JPN1]|uniref:Uncharacterized protein n=2 Tax=Candidatus Brocadiaceae TaxID=1127830 RepID=A0ABQ0K0Z3_9BACT|nr:hypothetical protein BROSI_A3273 [Candidatus Brocadia sinica JPN1]GIK11749.1 MAG: hypothetical protein BroJett002_04560 [Candidatus Brocadia sinica]GJQ18694.1 MAG: hypothetical protein HBSIN01_26530 [Candidatus Brocadia sinica]
MGYRVGIVESEKEIATKTDLLIADFHTFSRMSPETLFHHKVKTLLLLTDCLPKVEDQRLLEYISKGIIGILFPEPIQHSSRRRYNALLPANCGLPIRN